eukprot:m.407242 g.407242  ORF g.407242 m.407242 type:complete len:128 (+) comp20137_c0_seq22:1454-1837(+)
MEASVWRDGAVHDIKITTQAPLYIAPRHDGWDCNPSYFICGGLVFVPLTAPWAKAKKLGSLLDRYRGMIKTDGQQVVMLSKILAHDANFGYHHIGSHVLQSFNGTVRPLSLCVHDKPWRLAGTLFHH